MSTLDEIFTDEKEIDVELLGAILKGLVKINSETNTVFFTSDFQERLTLTDKILLFLLSRKALKIKGKIENEEVTPSEIISETDLKSGSVHPSLKILKKSGLLVAKGGKYFVPNHQLYKIKRQFEEKNIWMKK